MGWFQRLFSGAKSGDLHRDSSSNQAPASTELSEELRALKEEISLLRDALGGAEVLSSEGSARDNNNRNRRGGRNSRGSRNQGGSRDNNGRSRNNRNGRNNEPRKPRERKPIPDGAPVGLLVDYLKERDIWVYEGQDDLNRNEAFEHLARHLGVHFDALSPFYEKLKRCVANGRGQRIDIDHMSTAERSAAVQFGTLLHRHGMLKDFYYHRAPKKQLRVIPTKDGEIAQFLTGGWLEIYVSALIGKRLRASISPAKFQLMYNVKGSFSDGREFESDLMACVDGRLVWIECKTGHWQDYSARFRGLVKTFGCDRTSAGLLLIRPPDAATCKRATDMLDMTLMSLDHVDDFISVFLGEEPAPKPIKKETEQVTEEETPEEEIPLENVEAAKLLGRVNLNRDDETPQRRRRRRRGGRGPGRNSEKPVVEASEDKTDEGSKSKLVDPLPLTKFAADDSKDEDEKVVEAKAEEKPVAKKKTKRQAKRRGKPKKAESDTGDKPVEKEVKVEEPKAKPEPKAEPEAQEVKSASGTTIAPDLAAMMASGKEKTDDN